MTKTPDYYRRLQYTRRMRLEADEAGGQFFVAYIEELPGVEAVGGSDHEARSGLSSAFEDYLAAMLEWGEQIPEPLQWPESVGWDRNAPGVGSGTVTVAVLEGTDLVASHPAFARFDGAFNALQVGEELERAPETVAA